MKKNILRTWIIDGFAIHNPLKAFRNYYIFLRDWRHYTKMNKDGLEIKFVNIIPKIWDKTTFTSFDSHYVYQAIWANDILKELRPNIHVDIGSQIQFVGMISRFITTIFIDIRPITLDLPNFYPLAGNTLNLPIKSSSLHSVSCLHVLEHIGLGRYGDPIDPYGIEKAAAELNRIMSLGGYLLISIPIGRERVCFNAHKVVNPVTFLEKFPTFELQKFSAIDDAGHYYQTASPIDYKNANYACGLYCLRKNK